MSYSMGAYPPGTHAGDPRAPWNEEDAAVCATCSMWTALDDERGMCSRLATGWLCHLRRAEGDEELLDVVLDLVSECVTDDCHTCDDWEEES